MNCPLLFDSACWEKEKPLYSAQVGTIAFHRQLLTAYKSQYSYRDIPRRYTNVVPAGNYALAAYIGSPGKITYSG